MIILHNYTPGTFPATVVFYFITAKYFFMQYRSTSLISGMIIFVCCLLLHVQVSATNYFVSVAGNDGSNGLSVSSAFRTIQHAADFTKPGDTVFVMNGIYTNDVCTECNVATISRSGSSSKWIVYINYPGHKPLIQFTGWNAFNLDNGVHHIEINGFRIQGNNRNITLNEALNQPAGCRDKTGTPLAKYNGSGIGVEGRYRGHCHHLRFLNNTVYDCGAAGISVLQGDYITIVNNKIFNNSWYTIYGGSGISLYQPWNVDAGTSGYQNIIANNLCYGNRLYVPWVDAPCAITDGNGIIIDDSRHTQVDSANDIPYTGRTYVYNNLCIKNGGSGIHTYESEHVDIINNTAYFNSRSFEVNGGQIFANASNDIFIYNNILVSQPNKVINTNYNNTNLKYDYNLHWGGTDINITGPNCIKQDPQFVNASIDLRFADFHLKPQSMAINKGTGSKAPSKDYEYKPRPSGAGYDMGAYEYQFVKPACAVASKYDTEKMPLKIFPNPASSVVYVVTLNAKTIKAITLADITGKALPCKQINGYPVSVNISLLSRGVYFLQVQFEDGTTAREKIIK
jgi:parallel beta-helix repeat protein